MSKTLNVISDPSSSTETLETIFSMFGDIRYLSNHQNFAVLLRIIRLSIIIVYFPNNHKKIFQHDEILTELPAPGELWGRMCRAPPPCVRPSRPGWSCRSCPPLTPPCPSCLSLTVTILINRWRSFSYQHYRKEVLSINLLENVLTQ